MNTITYQRLSRSNFSENSLDGFIRHQEVKKSWRKTAQGLVLVDDVYTEEWNIDTLRENASELLEAADRGCIVYVAFAGDEVAGYVQLEDKLFGSSNQYVELMAMQVSKPYRRQGAGRRLFELAACDARKQGYEKLYISANSSQQTQAFYRSMGCIEAEEINREAAENEPFDIQMEYVL